MISPKLLTRTALVLLLAGVSTPLYAQSDPLLQPAVSTTDDDNGADILGAFTDSLRLLVIEHGTRVIFQEKTRRELGGKFWTDYRRSVRWPGQWEDSDAWYVNYVGHPIHGAAAGYLWLDHEPGDPVDISLDFKYWSSRMRAMAFAASYSLQFEIGPLSEASIGNVGMNPATTGWVDHVVTPVGAFGFIVAEDALDRFLVQWMERHTTNRFARAALRIAFNPGRALANGASGRTPWYRPGRPLGAQ
jgi:hypothetical protein